MKRLRTLKLFQIFRTKIKKSKTYSGLCPFQGPSNANTVMQIKSGRTVPFSTPGREIGHMTAALAAGGAMHKAGGRQKKEIIPPLGHPAHCKKKVSDISVPIRDAT